MTCSVLQGLSAVKIMDWLLSSKTEKNTQILVECLRKEMMDFFPVDEKVGGWMHSFSVVNVARDVVVFVSNRYLT